jgi:hypothetical protein
VSLAEIEMFRSLIHNSNRDVSLRLAQNRQCVVPKTLSTCSNRALAAVVVVIQPADTESCINKTGLLRPKHESSAPLAGVPW